MATKKVCDFCSRDMEEADTKLVERQGKVVYIIGWTVEPSEYWTPGCGPYDICRRCMADIAASRDERTVYASQPFPGLRFEVSVQSYKTPGPHALFHQLQDADLFAAATRLKCDIRTR